MLEAETVRHAKKKVRDDTNERRWLKSALGIQLIPCSPRYSLNWTTLVPFDSSPLLSGEEAASSDQETYSISRDLDRWWG